MLTCKKESKNVKKLMSDSSEKFLAPLHASNDPDSHGLTFMDHIDHAGPFLVAVDTHSKWLDVVTPSTINWITCQ